MKKPVRQERLERDMDAYRVVPAEEKSELRKISRTKIESYIAQGHGVFTATLSTFVDSRSIAKAAFPRFWNYEFIHRIEKRLPFSLRKAIDHDFDIEPSKEGHFHFHGWFAVKSAAIHKIWRDGKLTPAVKRDLEALAKIGRQSTFSVNSYLVEPLRPDDLERWIKYSSKDPAPISSIDYASEMLAVNRERKAAADADRSRKAIRKGK